MNILKCRHFKRDSPSRLPHNSAIPQKPKSPSHFFEDSFITVLQSLNVTISPTIDLLREYRLATHEILVLL